MQRSTAPALGLVVACVAVAGCGGFQPQPIEAVPFLDRVQTQTQNEIRVTVAVPTIDEARALFDTGLHKKRIQPVWIEIENRSQKAAWLFPYGVDRDYFPPLEVAWKSHRTWAGRTNRRIDAYYYEHALEPFVPASASASGFVFVPLDLGTRLVPVKVLQDDEVHEFEFYVSVPGFRADHTSVDFSGLYAEEEKRDLQTEDELRRWIERLPCCATNAKGTKTGDPLNFVLVAQDAAFVRSLVRAGWDETARLAFGTSMKTAGAAVFGKSYRNAPMSPLYVLGRPQDLGLQKARWNIHQRNHLRLWLAPASYRGAPIWIGQISRDIGSRLTTKSKTLTTHKIDPDVDEARDFLVLDLAFAESLSAFAYAEGVESASVEEPRSNLTGDPFFTDGLRAVLFLSERPTAYEDIRYLRWAEAER